jgi:hypothetical protein
MEKEKDQWDVKLDHQLEIIYKCQQDHNVDSCMKCEKLLNCEIRDNYVKAVYESMNKGSGGGFEF